MAILDGITLEQTVLGHALNSRSCFQLFAAELNYTHFASPNHRVLAYCLKQMAILGIERPDEDTFQLVIHGYPGQEEKDYGGTEYIRSLKSSFADPTENYEKFIDRIKVQSAKRTITTERMNSLVRIANDPRSEISDIRKIINEMSVDVETAASSGYNFVDMKQLGDLYLEEIQARSTRRFATTGFSSLDENLVEGFLPKTITVMAGFTGMAKSTVAVNMAHRVAAHGIGSAIFSMESTNVSLYDKLVSTLTQIPTKRLKKESADLTDEEKGRIKTVIEQIGALPLIINDQASISIDGILYQLQSSQRRGYDPKVIFIDLFGKIEDVDTGDNIAIRIQKEMKRMRVLAKTLDVHFVCVVQIGRQGFGRSRGKAGNLIRRPTLIDIKNANAYAEEPDICLLLHRNKYYLPDIDDDILEINIAKQRGGEIKTVYFELFPETSTIVDTDKLPHDVIPGAV